MIFKTLFVAFGLAVAGYGTSMAQSCSFAHDAVRLRCEIAPRMTQSVRTIDTPGAPVAETGPSSTTQRYGETASPSSWPVSGPVSIWSVEALRPLAFEREQFVRFELESAKPESTLIMDRLRRWRIDMTEGLGITLRNQAWRLALDYSDVFDAARFPDTGGHGISLLFRYSFEKHRQLARLAYR